MNTLEKPGLSGADDLCLLTGRELADGYAKGAFSPVEVAQQTLARAKYADQEFNAFTKLLETEALQQAAASQERWRRGAPLSAVDGVPATIKDIVLVRGQVCRYGSTSSPDLRAERDAPSVARMRAAGVVFLGLTTTPEFGWKAVTDSALSGVTTNPLDKRLTPGGSSGGAAVAAAVGAGVFHLGTDGGGSIRIPAAFTGICGIKPTFGRVPAYPASPFGTVAHIGPMARQAEDVASMLAIMSGRDLDDWFQGVGMLEALTPAQVAPRGMRIGVWRRPPTGQVDPEIAESFECSVKELAAAGAELVDIALPMTDALYDIFQKHWYTGAASRVAGLSQAQKAALDPGLAAIVETASGWSAADYVAAVSRRAAFGTAMDQLMATLDFIVSPGTSVLPFAAGAEVPPGSGLSRWVEWAGFSYPINLSQQPAAVVPSGQSAGGLPIALQIIAARGQDARVLGFAKWWENTRKEAPRKEGAGN